MFVIWYNPRAERFEYGNKNVFQRLKTADPEYRQSKIIYVLPYKLYDLVRKLCRELNMQLRKKRDNVPFT